MDDDEGESETPWVSDKGDQPDTNTGDSGNKTGGGVQWGPGQSPQSGGVQWRGGGWSNVPPWRRWLGLAVVVIVIVAFVAAYSYEASSRGVGLFTVLFDLTGTCTGASGSQCTSAYMTTGGDFSANLTLSQSVYSSLQGAHITGFVCDNTEDNAVSNAQSSITAFSQAMSITVPCGPSVVTQGTSCSARSCSTVYYFTGTISAQYTNSAGQQEEIQLVSLDLSGG